MTPDLHPSLTKDYRPTQICAVTSVIKWFVNNHVLQTGFQESSVLPYSERKAEQKRADMNRYKSSTHSIRRVGLSDHLLKDLGSDRRIWDQFPTEKRYLRK